MNGFSFCILDEDTGEFTTIENLAFDNKITTPQNQLEFIKNEFNNNKLLAQKFDSVNVTHSNNLSSLVPKPFFNEKNLIDYLQYNLKVLENDFIVFDRISNADIVNVYIPFVHINNYFFDKFGSFEYKHSTTVLVERLLKSYKNSSTTHFFVNVEADIFQIIVIKDKKLAFLNTFSFKTKEDFIYYILFTAEQLKLNPEEFQLTFLSDIEKESELYKLVFKYVRNVNFYSPEYEIPSEFKISKHSNFTLLNQY